MGIISIEKTNDLYWLGRYTQRVYTTLQRYSMGFDEMLDLDYHFYEKYCEKLNIPNIYTDYENFIMSYCYETENPDSIVSNLYRAYDNALILRDYISSEALAYIHLAQFQLKAAKISDAPLIELQAVEDNLLAFWGIIDDSIDDVVVRNLIKLGKKVELLDLKLRFDEDRKEIKRVFEQLDFYLHRVNIEYSKVAYYELALAFERGDDINEETIGSLENLILL
ncbi:MAG: alpha-E domain-containing protein [Clostridiales bacterium]|nr:alpha-E domain-containing protein [Clostridiales bacterium]